MKNKHIIIAVILLTMFYACGGTGESASDADSTSLAQNQPYITLTTDTEVGDKICIEVDYPSDAKVWIDLNNNQKLDEGEDLKRVDYHINDFGEEYNVDKTISVTQNTLNIYGPATYLFCPESNITELDISHNPNLEELLCHYNKLTSLKISDNKKLKKLYLFNNKVGQLNISQNPELDDLIIEFDYYNYNSSFKSNIYNFEPEWNKTKKTLEEQNLYPRGWHIFKLIKGNIVGNDKTDMIIVFEQDIPYAERKESNPVKYKLVVFEQIGNDKWKNAGEYEDFKEIEGYLKVQNNKLIVEIATEVETYETTIYTIEEGKIIKGKTISSDGTVISQGGTANESVEPNANGVYEVHNAQELLGSIASNRKIRIMSEKIDLSKLAYQPVEHEDYIVGLTIKDVENLSIEGGLPHNKRSEIELDDRENTVLIFKDCKNITLSNLHIGHKPQTFGCYGAVFAFLTCENVSIDNALMYGCGTQGIIAHNTIRLTCSNSIIEHCTYQAVLLKYCRDILFSNFNFRDNKLYGGVIDLNSCTNVHFNKGSVQRNNVSTSVIETTNKNANIVFEKVKFIDNQGELTTDKDKEVIRFIE